VRAGRAIQIVGYGIPEACCRNINARYARWHQVMHGRRLRKQRKDELAEIPGVMRAHAEHQISPCVVTRFTPLFS
jgi:hypothetical protein